MAITVNRNPLTFWEKLYLPAIFGGLKVTLKHAWGTLFEGKKVTMEYPEQKWTLPFWGLDHPAQSLGMGIVHILVFLAKMLFFMVVFIWVRWMFPRFRYDQLMDLGWRRFLPLALVNILITAVWLWLRS